MSKEQKPIISDESLLQQWEEGSDSAFMQLYNQYYEAALAYGIYLSRNRSVAENIVQQALEEIVKKVTSKKGKPIGNFKNYLFKIIKNKHIDHCRRRQNLRIEEEPSINFSTDFEENDFRQKILSLILTDNEKVVHELKMKGYNNAEVAKQLNKTEGQIRGLSYRIKRKVEKCRIIIQQELFGH